MFKNFLFLAFQICHGMLMVRLTLSCPCSIESAWVTFSHQSHRLCCLSYNPSHLTGAIFHTSAAFSQENNKCSIVSSAFPQQPHLPSPFLSRLDSTSLTGKQFCKHFHKKCLSFAFTFICHNFFHTLCFLISPLVLASCPPCLHCQYKVTREWKYEKAISNIQHN